jgi:hypothetical protein
MNEMEMQLSRMFNAAAGEPPNHITAHAARRQALKRRVIACLSATAALVVAGSIGLAVAANAIAPHRAADGHPQVTMPRYYFEMDLTPVTGATENLVRSVATGAITGRVHCPGPRWQTFSAVADSRQTFFIGCQTFSQEGAASTRIYRFQVSGSGRVSGFRPIPGGNLSPLRAQSMAVTGDGSLLAVAYASEVLVINTKTGSHATWRSDTLSGGVRLDPGDLSFARGDRELAIFGDDLCVRHGLHPRCKNPGEEMRVVSPAAKGGAISSGRRVLIKSQLIRPNKGEIASAFLGPDGRTAMVTVNTYLAAGGTFPGARVLQFSVATGKALRTLFNPASFKSALITYVDQSGRFVLLKALKKHDQVPVFGWIDHGQLRLLQPLRPRVADVIAW